MEGVAEVLLPFSIERLLEEICLQKGLEMPDVAARKTLSRISEESAIDVMKRVPMHYSSGGEEILWLRGRKVNRQLRGSN